jgi:hypothetical protein
VAVEEITAGKVDRAAFGCISIGLFLICYVYEGRHKRTLTPFKKSTSSDRNKMRSDLNVVFQQFQKHIEEFRPALNLKKVATGTII